MTHALWGIFSMSDEHKSQKAQQSQADFLEFMEGNLVIRIANLGPPETGLFKDRVC
jgi:hypothetical protein